VRVGRPKHPAHYDSSIDLSLFLLLCSGAMLRQQIARSMPTELRALDKSTVLQGRTARQCPCVRLSIRDHAVQTDAVCRTTLSRLLQPFQPSRSVRLPAPCWLRSALRSVTEASRAHLGDLLSSLRLHAVLPAPCSFMAQRFGRVHYVDQSSEVAFGSMLKWRAFTGRCRRCANMFSTSSASKPSRRTRSPLQQAALVSSCAAGATSALRRDRAA
jgi:hypothetical protein